MSLRLAYGDGEDCQFISSTVISGVTPIVSRVIDMRNFDDVGLQLGTTGTVSGTWKIEMSNDFVAATNGNAYGSVSGGTTPVGTFTDCTAFFETSATGTPIANPGGSPLSQYAKPKGGIRCRALRVTFTPSGGAGNASCLGNAASWSA